MPKINLAAEVFRARLVARRRNVLYALAVAVLIVVLGVWGVALLLTGAAARRTDAVKQDIALLDARLNARKDDVQAIRLFARRLELLRTRLDQHRGWVPLLEELERLVPPSAALLALAGASGTGEVDATAVVPNLDTAADLVASLQSGGAEQQTMFRAVAVAGISSETSPGGAYAVTLKLTADPQRFLLKPAAVALPTEAPPAKTAEETVPPAEPLTTP